MQCHAPSSRPNQTRYLPPSDALAYPANASLSSFREPSLRLTTEISLILSPSHMEEMSYLCESNENATSQSAPFRNEIPSEGFCERVRTADGLSRLTIAESSSR